MKPTHLLVVKTDTDGDYMSINTQDIKGVKINRDNETAEVVTSVAVHKLACMSKHRMERFTKELRDRYNLITFPAMESQSTNKDNSIAKFSVGDNDVYIWPKALFSITKIGAMVKVSTFCGDFMLEDPYHRVSFDRISVPFGLVRV